MVAVLDVLRGVEDGPDCMGNASPHNRSASVLPLNLTSYLRPRTTSSSRFLSDYPTAPRISLRTNQQNVLTSFPPSVHADPGWDERNNFSSQIRRCLGGGRLALSDSPVIILVPSTRSNICVRFISSKLKLTSHHPCPAVTVHVYNVPSK